MQACQVRLSRARFRFQSTFFANLTHGGCMLVLGVGQDVRMDKKCLSARLTAQHWQVSHTPYRHIVSREYQVVWGACLLQRSGIDAYWNRKLL